MPVPASGGQTQVTIEKNHFRRFLRGPAGTPMREFHGRTEHSCEVKSLLIQTPKILRGVRAGLIRKR